MKKLLILALVLVVAGGLFAQAAAPQVTLSGQVKYGLMETFAGYQPSQYWDTQINTNIVLDANTKALVRMQFARWANNRNEYSGFTTLPQGVDRKGQIVQNPLTLSRAYVDSELIGALGLKGVPVTNNLILGMNYWATDLNAGIDAAAISDLTEQGVGTEFTIVNRLGIMNMVFVTFGVTPANFKDGAGGWLVDALINVAPLQINANYREDYRGASPTAGYNQLGKGKMALGAKFSQAFAPIMLDAYAAGCYTLWSGQPEVGLAAKVAFEKLAYMQLGLYGYGKQQDSTSDFTQVRKEDSWLNRVSLRAVVTPVSIISLDVGTVLNIEPKKNFPGYNEVDGSMLNELEFSVWLNVAPTATIQIGYYLLGDSAYSAFIAGEQGWVGTRSGTAGYFNTIEKGGFFIGTKLTF